MDDETIISRGLLRIRDELLTYINIGVSPDRQRFEEKVAGHCLDILLSDDTGPGASAFPFAGGLARAFRRAGHPCRWLWWETGGPLYVARLTNSDYSLYQPAGSLVTVAIGKDHPEGRMTEVAVRPEDFVSLLEHFDANILPILPRAVREYVFSLEKETVARRIRKVVAELRSRTLAEETSESA